MSQKDRKKKNKTENTSFKWKKLTTAQSTWPVDSAKHQNQLHDSAYSNSKTSPAPMSSSAPKLATTKSSKPKANSRKSDIESP